MDEQRGITPATPAGVSAHTNYLQKALEALKLQRAQSIEQGRAKPDTTADDRSGSRSGTPASPPATPAATGFKTTAGDLVSISHSSQIQLLATKPPMQTGRGSVPPLTPDKRDSAQAVYEANREASLSLGMLDISDEAGVRALSEGLLPAPGKFTM